MLFGGGNVVLPVAQKQLEGLVKPKQLCEFYAVARSLPGIVAPNFAALAGYKLGRLPGALAAVLGLVLPPVALIVLLAAGFDSIIYLKFVQSIFWGIGIGVVMLIFMGVQDIWETSVEDRFSFILFFAAFVMLAGFRVPPSAIVMMAIMFAVAMQMKSEEGAK